MPNTLSKVILLVPPFICAVMARDGRQTLSREALAKRAGLSLRMVERLAVKWHWDGVDTNVCSRFAAACNVDLFQPSKVRKFLRSASASNRPLNHLTPAARKAFNRCLEKWMPLVF